jgi:hypothetical protein
VIVRAEADNCRNLFATVTYYPSPDLDKVMQDIMVDEIQAVKTVPGFYPTLLFQPLYEAAIHAGRDRGGNAAGIDAEGPLTGTVNLLLQKVCFISDCLSCSIDRALGDIRGR